MKCVVAGAYGFIGQAIARALMAAGHEVIGAGRNLALGRRLLPGIEWIYTDFNDDVAPIEWAGQLDGVDVLINAVGILQSDLKDQAELVHDKALYALFKGAEAAGVGRVIHISATTIGEMAEGEDGERLERPQAAANGTAYSRSKHGGERQLKSTKVSWVILRPDFVIGPNSAGGAMLLRGLAGLPFILPYPGDGGQKFQPIAVSDLAALVVRLAETEEAEGETVAVVGPEVKSLRQMIADFRQWLGFGKALPLPVPMLLIRMMALLGDAAALLGNRSALRSTALVQMGRFQEHDGARFEELLGRRAMAMTEALDQTPASLPDRVYARMYFWLPLMIAVVGFAWIFEGYEQLAALVESGSFGTMALAASLSWEGVLALLSMVAGVFFLSARWRRVGGAIKLALILGAGLLHFAYLSSFQQGVGLFFSMAVPVLLIVLLLGLAERR